MNPESIYTRFRDEALAEMFTSDRYDTFVAMPFRQKFSYRPQEILEKVIQKSVMKANILKGVGLKTFSIPLTVENLPGTANVITEDIVKKILFSHFFLADLTGGNAGVLLETGIAMAFKSNSQIILITQDPLCELHFDIRNNRVVSYNPNGNVDVIARAFLAAAHSFEEDRRNYVTQLSQHLSPEAIQTIGHYGRLYQKEVTARGQPGLHFLNVPEFFETIYGSQALTVFTLTLQELQSKRMTWTDYTIENRRGKKIERWAVHVTKLGWLLIKHFWPKYKTNLCNTIR